MQEQRKPNRLAQDKSPYLLKHAYNPVDWYPWGEEALAKARSENKPIFLSIGYSTCHWCTVMERESFEDEEIARILNEHFVPIKVDREERPDLDEIYMKAVMSLTGQGGWPLNAFLTPDLKPFYGGTYFPPVDRHGLPSFRQVLTRISETWKNRRREVLTEAEQLTEALKRMYAVRPTGGDLAEHWLDDVFVRLADRFDQAYGGFGGAPKFPSPSNLLFLLRYHHRAKKPTALKMVVKTLEAMADGGIHDQLAGGFHRYSVDYRWLIPHFEKMLYDNALLAKTYLEAYLVTQNPKLAATARPTLEWMRAEMTAEEGGFYSAQDADSPEGEGAYYVWSRREILELLGDAGPLIADYFGVQEKGNFEEGKSVLAISTSPEDFAKKHGLRVGQLEETVTEAKNQLLQARAQRTKPATDDKILTSWNGLAISAFALGHQVLGEARYREAAAKAAEFVLHHVTHDGALLRRYRDGTASLDGTIEDYAFFIQGLVDLYEADFRVPWLEEAVRLADQMMERFWDATSGGFFFTPPSTPDLLTPIKEGYDGATPSGNSVAALDLLRLAEYTGKEIYRERGKTTIQAFGGSIEAEPTAHTYMLCALDFLLGRPKEIVVAGDPQAPLFGAMLHEVRSRYLPNKVIAFASKEAARIMPFVEGKDGPTPTVYVCEKFVCNAPAKTVDALRSALEH